MKADTINYIKSQHLESALLNTGSNSLHTNIFLFTYEINQQTGM